MWHRLHLNIASFLVKRIAELKRGNAAGNSG